jgi:hypothetical protein
MKKYPFEEFAKRLNHLANQEGITSPAELARVTGLNRVTCGAYMRGERGASLEACVQITDAIGGEARWLHSGNQEAMLRGGQRLNRHAAFNAPIYQLKDKEQKTRNGLMEYAQALDKDSPARILVENMARQPDLERIAELEAQNRKLKDFIKEML